MNKELRTLLSKMRRRNLTAEAKKIEQIVGEKKEYYQELVFLKKEKDFDEFEGGMKGFFDPNTYDDDRINYLQQRINKNGDILDTEPWGHNDILATFEQDGQMYYMAFNRRSGFAALVRLVPEDEYSNFDINPEEDVEAGKITGEKKEYYQDIVYLQMEDDFSSFPGGSEGFFDADEDAQYNYLMQWEQGEGEILDQEPWGTNDDVEKIERGGKIYYMSLNSGLGAAGLVRLVHEDEYSDFDINPEED